MNKNFEDISLDELENIDGGLFVGALAGGILGGTVGLVAGTVKGVATGNLTGNELWKCYTAGALAGAAIGTYTPF